VSLNSTELFAHLQQYHETTLASLAERSGQVGGRVPGLGGSSSLGSSLGAAGGSL
jgi:hypothetical protein